MALTHVLLFFHLLGAFSFLAGATVAGVLQVAAMRRERPSEVATLLGLTRAGVALVGVGSLLTLGFGIALAEHEGIGFSPAWIQAALGLWVASMALGGYGGRTARHARYLAERLAAEGDAPSVELRDLVSSRVPLLASYASGLLLLAILGLMVWQPGSSSSALPASLKRQIVSGDPRIAYVPTRVPAGFALSEYAYYGDGYRLDFTRQGNALTDLDFDVETISSCSKQPMGEQKRYRLNGAVVLLHYGEDGQQAWECRRGSLIEAMDYPSGYQSNATETDLVRLVAYAERVS